VFFTCKCCDAGWDDYIAFLGDSTIKLVGFQISLSLPDRGGYYYFDHLPCGTTLALKSELLSSMIDEPIPERSMQGTDECSKYCLELNNFPECKNECRNAPFRRLAIRILEESE